MLINYHCDDLSEQSFDEIEKDSIKLRKIECEHYNVSIKLYSGNYFEKIIFAITCNSCKNKNQWEYKMKENEIIYSCKKCNKSQVSLNYIITEDNQKKSESEIKKPITYTNNNDTNYILNEPDKTENEKQNTNKENIQINVDYNGNTKSLTFNLRDSFDKQYHKFYEIFGIKNKKDLYFNSTKLDIYKNLKENELYDNCFIEIID